MDEDLYRIWVYLAEQPLLGLTLTLVAYQAGEWIYNRFNRHPLANPVLLAVLALVGVLWATGMPYRAYFEGAQFIHFLLGPATVALAVPLYTNLQRMRRSAWALSAALVAGSATAIVTAVSTGWLLGAGAETLASLAPKSVTSPIAMGVADQVGGLPSLTALLVILTGILGGVTATWILDALGINDWRARGFATGLAAHGIGTARAFELNPVAGAFASLAMGLNGVATAILMPLLFRLLT